MMNTLVMTTTKNHWKNLSLLNVVTVAILVSLQPFTNKTTVNSI